MFRRVLLTLVLCLIPMAAIASAVPMPEKIIIIACKTISHGGDKNSSFTGWEDRVWATKNSMMVCRRQEIALYDPDVDLGAAPIPFSKTSCWMAAMRLGPAFDAAHRTTPWRFWRAACPTPIVRKNGDGTEDIIGWKLPECGHRDTVVCEQDTLI
jgi:hypothetical protein